LGSAVKSGPRLCCHRRCFSLARGWDLYTLLTLALQVSRKRDGFSGLLLPVFRTEIKQQGRNKAR